jgi:hypothetical protein
MQDRFLDELESLLQTAQVTDRVILILVIIAMAIMTVIIYLLNRRQTNRTELLIREREQTARLDAERWIKEQQNRNDERLEKERLAMVQTQAAVFTKSFELVGDKFDAAMEKLAASDQRIASTLDVLVTESRKERELHLDRLTRIEELVAEHISSADIRLRNALHDHNRQAMERYGELSKIMAQIESMQQSIYKLLEDHGDCDRELAAELHRSLVVARDIVSALPQEKPEPPDPKPPRLVVIDAPQKPAEEGDEDADRLADTPPQDKVA